jgi:hypothetical protein
MVRFGLFCENIYPEMILGIDELLSKGLSDSCLKVTSKIVIQRTFLDIFTSMYAKVILFLCEFQTV